MNISTTEFLLMQKYIEENCGIQITEDKSYLIECRLAKLLAESGARNFHDFYQILNRSFDKKMAEKVIDSITTHETQWFRDKNPWQILEDLLLPQYIQEMREGKRAKARIWSLACSTGQEPYSTAMCIHRYLETRSIKDIRLSQFEIVATDISQSVLNIAKAGRYDNISITRGLDETYRDRYFKQEGRVWVLDQAIKNSVHFFPFNLLDRFNSKDIFDIIFCRYVTIYFSEQFKRDVFSKIANALSSEGILFLGNSELITVGKEMFVSKQFRHFSYYQIKQDILSK